MLEVVKYKDVPGAFTNNIIYQNYFWSYLRQPGYELSTLNPGYELSTIQHWADEIDMELYYNDGTFYFENTDDLLSFQLRWC